ncbi:glycosyltransferase [Vibrio splendidus]
MKNIIIYSETSVIGGHEIMTVSLARYLIQLGCKVHFIVPSNSEKYISYITEHLGELCALSTIKNDVTGYPLLSLINFFDLNKRSEELEKLVLDISPDLIVVSQGNIEMSLLGIKIAKRLSIPYYSYLAYTDYFSETGAKLGKLRDSINNLIYKYIAKFILVDDIYKSDLMFRYALDDLYVVENKLENLKFKKSENSVYNSNKSKNITLLGRLYTKQKGQDVAIYAIKKLVDTYHYTNFKLNIVGTGPDEQFLKKLVLDLDISSHVTFTDWCSDVSHVYDNSDIILLPSNYEGFCLVLLESVYLNKRIVASNINVFRSFLLDEQIFTKGCVSDLVNTLIFNLNENKVISYKRQPCLDDTKNFKSLSNLLANLE